jgi:glycosyltransferase involved in cell wall biosynthesis
MFDKAPRVSVIMPTYNHGVLLKKAVASVLAQSYSDWELLVVDDGSDDSTPMTMEALAHQDEHGRIRYLRQKRRGAARLSETYNATLRYARGELVAILEGDDEWPDDKLERQVPDFDDSELVLSYGNYATLSPAGTLGRGSRLERRASQEDLNNRPTGSMVRLMAERGMATVTFPCTVVMRRSALDQIGGFKGCGGEVDLVDFPTFIELARLGPFRFHEKLLGFWRRHDTQLTTQFHGDLTHSVYEYAHVFAARNPELIDKKAMDAAWRERFRFIALTRGRRFALLKQWRDARREFLKVMRGNISPNPITAAAALGYGLSFLRCTMERPVAMLRKWM